MQLQLQTTLPERKFPNEYSDVIFIQVDQHLKKFLQIYKGVPILWNTVKHSGDGDGDGDDKMMGRGRGWGLTNGDGDEIHNRVILYQGL